jgi:hypothetical protein
MGSGFSSRIRVSLGALFLLSAGASTFAQEAPLDDLAQRMADSLAWTKQKSFAVFAFVGPDDTEAREQKLAGDF